MSKDNSALEEQLERIQTEINETTDPERLKYIAMELVSAFRYLYEGLPSGTSMREPHTRTGLLMIPHYLSDITEEPEKCQRGQCENWALAGEFFCEEHVDEHE